MQMCVKIPVECTKCRQVTGRRAARRAEGPAGGSAAAMAVARVAVASALKVQDFYR